MFLRKYNDTSILHIYKEWEMKSIIVEENPLSISKNKNFITFIENDKLAL